MNIYVWAKRLRHSFVIHKLLEIKYDPNTLPALLPMFNNAVQLELDSHMWKSEAEA